jgi:hypothetical protein
VGVALHWGLIVQFGAEVVRYVCAKSRTLLLGENCVDPGLFCSGGAETLCLALVLASLSTGPYMAARTITADSSRSVTTSARQG